MDKLCLSSKEIAESFIEIGYAKVKRPAFKHLILGILAGAFIALACAGSNSAIHTINSAGLAKALAGTIFATGLVLVVVAGGDLFTGNCLIVISCLEKKSKFSEMLKNWFFVYIGNFIGAIIIAYLIIHSGQLNFTNGLLGGFTINTGVYKTGLSFKNAFVMGILCNILVCLAVWMAAGAKDMAGKILAIFFPIWLFISAGFEHSVANMYYITAAIMAKANPEWVNAAEGLGVTTEKLANLNWGTLFTKNLIPVTLGNLVGGALLVGFTYWLVYLRKPQKN